MTASISDIPLQTIKGEPAKLADYKGRVLLVVNVASKCGLTPQYEGLQKLYEEKHGAGLEILGFPANDFRGQEPGTEAEIADFCSTTYNVTFPLFSKIEVTGENIHPLYAGLIAAKPEAAGGSAFRDRLAGFGMTPNPAPGVLWNFEKFVVGRDGSVIGRFTPDTTADDPNLVSFIDKALTA
jgi:glutathione peroxidase